MPWTDEEIRKMRDSELLSKHRREHQWIVLAERSTKSETQAKLREIIKAHAQLAREMERRGMKHTSPLTQRRPNTLAALKADLLVCRLCGPNRYVPPEGSPEAKTVIVGESPGEEELKKKRPFVGAAGRRLMKVLEQLGLSRRDVYLTNAVKCYLGRTPTRREIEECRPWLLRELRLLGPGKRIIALGRVAGLALAGEKKVKKAPHPVARRGKVSQEIAAAVGRRG